MTTYTNATFALIAVAYILNAYFRFMEPSTFRWFLTFVVLVSIVVELFARWKERARIDRDMRRTGPTT